MNAHPEAARVRLDKWLWFARFFKTRSLATKVVASGHVRVNGTHVSKPSTNVGKGDTVTFPQARDVRVIRIDATGSRRGPATEAQALYTDLAPPQPRTVEKAPSAPAFEGGGRPTKRDRRKFDQVRRDLLE